MSKFLSTLALSGLLAASTVDASAGPTIVGVDSPLSIAVNGSTSYSTSVSYPRATYVAVHFDSLNVPEGESVTVRSPNGETSYTYTGKRDEPFYATYISGDTAIVEYTGSSASSADSSVFTIDKFAHGVKSIFRPDSICGADNSKPAVCYKTSNPAAYKNTQAVARLLIDGKSLCTGWLVGSEGHLITNNHCIGSAADATKTQFEFKAEGPTCTDACNNQQLGCKGSLTVSSSTFVKTSPINGGLDYTLVKLKTSPSLQAFGYLKLRQTPAKVNEQIYIPEHPAGKAKRIALVTDDGKPAKIDSISASNSCGSNQIGYAADTEGGSSGSPVLAVSDNKVVALHHCGGCPNTGHKIDLIIADLKKTNNLPKDAI